MSCTRQPGIGQGREGGPIVSPADPGRCAGDLALAAPLMTALPLAPRASPPRCTDLTPSSRPPTDTHGSDRDRDPDGPPTARAKKTHVEEPGGLPPHRGGERRHLRGCGGAHQVQSQDPGQAGDLQRLQQGRLAACRAFSRPSATRRPTSLTVPPGTEPRAVGRPAARMARVHHPEVRARGPETLRLDTTVP